jgi:Leucine-rich repeat (LRR) protein
MTQSAVQELIRDAKRRSAKDLWIYDDSVAELPGELGDLSSLTTLAIGCEKLRSLPPQIGNLRNLSSLEIRYGMIEFLPLEIGQLKRLTELRLSVTADAFFFLPDVIGELSELRFLYIQGRITILPAQLGQLRKLEHLAIRSGYLETLHPDIGNLDRLANVYLSYNKLTELPSTVEGLTSLTTLDLSSNRLRELPPGLGKAKSLTTLKCDSNSLVELPPEIGDLSSLTRLYLDNNLLKRLPKQIGSLSNLEYLDLHSNELTFLPEEIGYLRNLKQLDLEKNQLTDLPSEIGNLASLTSLKVKGNHIRALPSEITRLKNLIDVQVHENQPEMLSPANLTKEWDVFISHASEDKAAVAAPLAQHLTQAGLRVWLDKQEIFLGDSIREKIDEGLSRSRFGVVILSPAFFGRNWTNRELNALMSIEENGQQVILPVWHQVDKSQVVGFSPVLSDKLAANTQAGIFSVASQIIDRVLYSSNDSPTVLRPTLTHQLVQMICNRKVRKEIRDFLLLNRGIIENAYGQFSDDSEVIAPPDLPQYTPDILFGRHLWSANTSVYSYIALGPLEEKLFLDYNSGDETLNDMIAMLKGAHSASDILPTARRTMAIWGFASKRRVGHEQPSVLVAGRRFALNPQDTDRLNELNSSLAEAGIKIRTYDWLIDGCRAWESKDINQGRRY